jgi:hypothetical protein
MAETVYWTMKNGQKINVDDMDINHLRNTLKMIIRNKQSKQSKPQLSNIEKRFQEAEIEAEHQQMLNDLGCEYDAEDFGCRGF